MKIILFLLAFYLSLPDQFYAAEKPEEKSYSERLKEVASEKLRKSKDLYDKGVKVASDKYAETFEEGKDFSGKSKEWLLKDIQNSQNAVSGTLAAALASKQPMTQAHAQAQQNEQPMSPLAASWTVCTFPSLLVHITLA